MSSTPTERPSTDLGWLDRPMSVLGLLFLLVVLAEPLVRDGRLAAVLTAVGWLLWAVFVAEFVLHWWFAADRSRYLRRNWWQLVLLAVPFLRFVRLLRAVRVAPFGRLLSSAVRGSRSAGRLLSGRLGWLGAVTAVVVLAASHLLYLTGAVGSYGEALHRSALATISGEPIGVASGWSEVLEVFLATYSVIVFATLAASLGAFFLHDRSPATPTDGEADEAAATGASSGMDANGNG